MTHEKYLGIPWVEEGRDFSGCDCYGLVRLYLANEAGLHLPDIYTKAKTDMERDLILRTELHSRKNVIRVGKKDIKENDIVVMSFYHSHSHIGVYVGHASVLHTIKPSSTINSFDDIIGHKNLYNRIVGVYRWQP